MINTIINHIIIPIILLIFAGILFGERNTIQIKPQKAWFQWEWFKKRFPRFSKWWNSNNWKYENPTIQWLMRYPLSFLKDGTHYLESSIVVIISMIMSIYIPLIPLGLSLENYRIEMIILLYAIFGMSFNYSYHK